MNTIKVTVAQQENSFHFRGVNAVGHTVDTDNYTGYQSGIGSGVTPMELLIIAIVACSGIDIVDILRKGKQHISSFDMDVVGQKPKGVAPSLFNSIHITYRFSGDTTEKRVRRAIELSLGKYCSVAKTLEKTAGISYDYFLNGEHFNGSPLA